MSMGFALILLGVLLGWWGLTLPGRRVPKEEKAKDLVAYYIDMAIHLPDALRAVGGALLLLIGGLVLLFW